MWFIPPGTAQAASCTEHVLEAEQELSIPARPAAIHSTGGKRPGRLSSAVRDEPGRQDRLFRQRQRGEKPICWIRKGRVRQKATVGCMQLSVQHHRANFRPVERILDPSANVWYAARYLKRLRADSGSWSVAAARYNGGSRSQQRDYTCKIYQHLESLDKNSASLLEGNRCAQGDPAIAPETRRRVPQGSGRGTGLTLPEGWTGFHGVRTAKGSRHELPPHLPCPGSFTDVMKHAVVALILERLRAKETPFGVLDTHAGIGRYDLTSQQAGRTGEYLGGIARVMAAADQLPPGTGALSERGP